MLGEHQLVPVILRRTYRSRSKRKDYVATIVFMANNQGEIVSGGVAFEGGEYDGKTVTHSKAIGRSVAIGRAVKAFVEQNHNSLNDSFCTQANKVEQETNFPFSVAKGYCAVAPTKPHIMGLPEEICEKIALATSKKLRLAVNEDGKWRFVGQTKSK